MKNNFALVTQALQSDIKSQEFSFPSICRFSCFAAAVPVEGIAMIISVSKVENKINLRVYVGKVLESAIAENTSTNGIKVQRHMAEGGALMQL